MAVRSDGTFSDHADRVPIIATRPADPPQFTLATEFRYCWRMDPKFVADDLNASSSRGTVPRCVLVRSAHGILMGGKSPDHVLALRRRRPPRSVAALPSHTIDGPGDIDAAVQGVDRVLVIGTDSDLAAVLTRLIRTDRLATLKSLRPGGVVLCARTAGGATGSADPRRNRHRRRRFRWRWIPPAGASTIHGEAVVDDSTLFNGDVAGIESTDLRPARIRAAIVAARCAAADGSAAGSSSSAPPGFASCETVWLTRAK